MLSNKPYLLRAFYQWIVDSQCVPIVVINVLFPNCKIPQDYSDGGEIVFNISPSAVRDLKITNDFLDFKASFSGVIHIINVPINAILAIYAEENGEGIFFDGSEDDIDGTTSGTVNFQPIEQDVKMKEKKINNKPFLKLVE